MGLKFFEDGVVRLFCSDKLGVRFEDEDEDEDEEEGDPPKDGSEDILDVVLSFDFGLGTFGLFKL